MRDGLLATCPTLTSEVECDVLVVGAGVTGALCAWQLVRAGLDTVVVDARAIGWGSTCASTALLMYDLDTSLVELTQRLGRECAEGVRRAAGLACYGGNWTVSAMLASELVRDWCVGRKNEMAEWFRFDK